MSIARLSLRWMRYIHHTNGMPGAQDELRRVTGYGLMSTGQYTRALASQWYLINPQSELFTLTRNILLMY